MKLILVLEFNEINQIQKKIMLFSVVLLEICRMNEHHLRTEVVASQLPCWVRLN